ncbi:MAG: patatin-like phospholipase family protein, partial [Bacteroidales bacterium]|nr:patatin-like phospholipase family protein [Bacteroidales bacterium]
METKKAIVFTGGSIKGAFQAGAFRAVTEKGFKPDFIYGISVGSLNGSFVINEVGKQKTTKENINWTAIANNLIGFWKCNIRKPEDVVIKRSAVSLLYKGLFNRFDGLVDTTPIKNLVRKTISMNNIYNSCVGFKVGAVNISDGKIIYADITFPDFIDYVLASTAIPIMMPAVNIGGNESKPFLDGGLREVAPLKPAIEAGCDEIICISCHAEELSAEAFNYKNIMRLSERAMDIVVNENVNNDIAYCKRINMFCGDYDSFMGYRKINLKVIRPNAPINLDLQNFNTKDIQALIELGYQTA